MRGTTYATRIGSRSVCKDFRDAVVAALYARPLGTHELALAIGRGDYGNLHDRLRQMERDGLIIELRREMRQTKAGRPAGKQIIWSLPSSQGRME